MQPDGAPLGRLHVVTDCRTARDPLPVVEASLSVGAPVIQVRAKHLSDRALFALALRIRELCDAAGASCVLDDRLDIALAVGAAGTHLGAGDVPVEAARRVVGPGHLLGSTARDPVTGRALVGAGASYLGVGPVFATRTKAGLPDAIGPSGVGAVASAVPVPVIAIGGVTAASIPQLLGAGAWGVAVVSAVSDAADPAAATRALLEALAA